jgi:hypothetical protein
MPGYALWMAKCTTCDTQGPVARDENDENALDWCVQHNADNRDHVAMIVAGSE